MLHTRMTFLKAWVLSAAPEKIEGTDYLSLCLDARIKLEDSCEMCDIQAALNRQCLFLCGFVMLGGESG